MLKVVLQYGLGTLRWNTNLISHPFNLLPSVYIQNTEIKKPGFISVYIIKDKMENACKLKIGTTNKRFILKVKINASKYLTYLSKIRLTWLKKII